MVLVAVGSASGAAVGLGVLAVDVVAVAVADGAVLGALAVSVALSPAAQAVSRTRAAQAVPQRDQFMPSVYPSDVAHA